MSMAGLSVTAMAPQLCGLPLHIEQKIYMLGDPGSLPPLHLSSPSPGLALDQTPPPLDLRWWAKSTHLLDHSTHPDAHHIWTNASNSRWGSLSSTSNLSLLVKSWVLLKLQSIAFFTRLTGCCFFLLFNYFSFIIPFPGT